MSEGKIYKVKASFWYHDDEDDTPKLVKVGSRVREGHPLMVGREELFVEDAPEFEVEEVEETPRRRGPGRPRKNPA